MLHPLLYSCRCLQQVYTKVIISMFSTFMMLFKESSLDKKGNIGTSVWMHDIFIIPMTALVNIFFVISVELKMQELPPAFSE